MRIFLLGLSILVAGCGASSGNGSPTGGGGDGSGGSEATGGNGGNGGAGATGGTGGAGGSMPETNLAWQKSNVPGPSRRTAAAMAYDEKRGVIVLYGGVGCVDAGCSMKEDLQDLWEWDGMAWKEVPMAAVWPGPRERHAMAYDPTREQVVVHGGGGSGTMMSWNGSAWTEIVAFCNFGCPAGRKDHAMAFHKGRGHLVAYSGIGTALNDVSISVRADSYELVGEYWQPIGGAMHPDGRVGGQLAYDPKGDLMWLFGGSSEYSAGFDGYPNDVWKLDTNGWNRVNEGGDPSDTLPWGRREAIFVWHPALEKAVLFGGFSYPASQIVGGLETNVALGVWTWNGTAWEKHPEWYLQESFRSDQAAAPFPSMKQVVQFGGTFAGDFPTDTMYLFGPQ